MKNTLRLVAWTAVAALGAWAYLTLALRRGEPINASYLLIAAFCSYAVGYRFYSKWIATRVLMVNDRRATPSAVHDDGKEYVRTNKWIVFGHHFAAISGPGPLVGPVLAAQFGYLPGTLWILIGVVLGGAVQDFVVLFCSVRRDGKSLAQMVREELNDTAGVVAMLAILAIMIILLAVLALVVVRALAHSPWGAFTVGATIPIAMLMGGYLRFIRIGKVLEVTAIGVALLLLAVWGGKFVHQSPMWSKWFTMEAEPIAWLIIFYGLAASILPVWLLLAPRDYLSTFMKLGTIATLALGIFLVRPDLQMSALTRFVDGSGLVFAGKLFPFCFITIACGAISGFHSLISSGTTPKLITRESYSRPVGYGAMCFESLVAIMAMIAACTLEPGVYFSMNVKGDTAGAVATAQARGFKPSSEVIDRLEGEKTAAAVSQLGFPVTLGEMSGLANTVKEKTLFGRTGGAATLAVGMAQIFSRAVGGRWLDLWYHFAIMFEALFILTTIDAGTRVGRYLLQDCLGRFWKPLADLRSPRANFVASVLLVSAWGCFLIQGVRDPLGGINSLWPLFGIANQLLAAIALCLATTVILKMHLAHAVPLTHAPALGSQPATTEDSQEHAPKRPAYAWVTLVPLVWLLAVTLTAGEQKIFSPEPKIGFLAQARVLEKQRPALEAALAQAKDSGVPSKVEAAEQALKDNRGLYFNQLLDAVVAGLLMGLVVLVVFLSATEWILLLARKRLAQLHETAPVWLPEYALFSERPVRLIHLLPFALALLKELSGQSAVEREAQQTVSACHAGQKESGKSAYLRVTARRFDGINRCC